MHTTQRFTKNICAAFLVLSTATAASSQSLPARGQSDTDWRYTLGLFAFLPLTTKGTSTIAGRTVPYELDLGDVLGLLDFAAAGRFEAWKGDFGLILDANYVSITGDGPFPIPPGSSFSVNVRQQWLGLLAAYRVADGTYGVNSQRYTIDIQGGARMNALRQELTLTTPGPLTPPVIGGDESWWEPVVGARGMWRLNEQWTTVASIDLGGFGAGGNDLQVGANFGFDYQPWDNTAITFGYRFFSMDYSTTLASGTFAYDTKQHGPYVGVKFLFN